MKTYDYIVIGAGAAGMQVLAQICSDSFFGDKSVLVIDSDSKRSNDRTWCWWQREESSWDRLLTKKWGRVEVRNGRGTQKMDVSNIPYKMLHAASFYDAVRTEIGKHSGIDWVSARFKSLIEEDLYVDVVTESETYRGKYVFNSVADMEAARTSKHHPWLSQHFIGWFVRTEEPVFDASTALLMDFSVEQKGNTRFMYVLPTSSTEALVEYTLFSDELLNTTEYENAIEDYLRSMGISSWHIERKEQGEIPMTTFPFWKKNTRRILFIGTAGGWTRPSTGYTFYNSMKQSARLAAYLKSGMTDMRRFHKSSRYDFYDFVVLDVLKRRNDLGADFFARIFYTNPIEVVFDFLNGESTVARELRLIFYSKPKLHLIYAVFRFIFRRLGFKLYA